MKTATSFVAALGFVLLTGAAHAQSIQPCFGIAFDANNPRHLVLTPFNDVIVLNSDAQGWVVWALEGNDSVTIYQQGGATDHVCGGTGNDVIYIGVPNGGGQAGPGFIQGGPGDDDLSVGPGAPYEVHGHDGNDTITTSTGADTVYGGDGDDLISTSTGNDTVYGGAGADIIDVSTGADFVDGGDGADEINGDTGDDVLLGGNGADTIYGYMGNDAIYGGPGDDDLFGDTGTDLIYGEDGDDYIAAGADNDTLYGGPGFDTLEGGSGSDQLYGGDHGDHLNGGADIKDWCDGGNGIDFHDGGCESLVNVP